MEMVRRNRAGITLLSVDEAGRFVRPSVREKGRVRKGRKEREVRKERAGKERKKKEIKEGRQKGKHLSFNLPVAWLVLENRRVTSKEAGESARTRAILCTWCACVCAG
jgi:hypothetical protein